MDHHEWDTPAYRFGEGTEHTWRFFFLPPVPASLMFFLQFGYARLLFGEWVGTEVLLDGRLLRRYILGNMGDAFVYWGHM